MAKKQLGMVIDTRACIGCDTCAVACKIENNLPEGVWWNRTVTVGGDSQDTPAGQYPNLAMMHLTIACQHCENPPCVAVCPTGATWKDEETGIVMQDQSKCIGCAACIEACPYVDVRTFQPNAPTYNHNHAIGSETAQIHQQGTVSKCTLCSHRVAVGEEPACISQCPARARFFGDFNDPESEVSQLINERESFTLRPEAGTNPSIHFLK